MPAEQRLHAGTSLLPARHDDNSDLYLNGHSAAALGPPPSYSTTDALHFASDTKRGVEDSVGLADSPAQLPFDDFAGGSVAPRTQQRSLPHPPHQQHQQQQPEHAMGDHAHDTRDPDAHAEYAPDGTHRPPPAPRSASDTRPKLGKGAAQLEEVDPYGNKFHEEGPFEAGRRAQRVEAAAPPNLNGHLLANGRFPSIKPGEIMPIKTIWPVTGPPSFTPPLEAPSFPPIVQNPIRPAHFPTSLHPPQPEPTRAPSTRQQQPPPAPVPPALPRSHSHRTTPAPASQPPRDLLRSHTQHNVPRATRPPPQNSMLPDAQPPPAPSRRHTFNPRDGVPPGLAPTGRYPTPQLPPPPPVPQSHQPPYIQPSAGPPSRSQSQSQSQSQSRHHPPPPPRSAFRDPNRHSLPAPPPSRDQFEPHPPVPSPMRLPSQNVPTPQALGIVHTPPPPSGSPRPDPSRPPRSTPKPVMPQLLAPLASVRQYDLTPGTGAGVGGGGGVTGPLHRSASSAAITTEKGGFLAKTRSILRKRTSTSGIKTRGDGAISFAPTPTMPGVVEEHGGAWGKRLSKRK